MRIRRIVLVVLLLTSIAFAVALASRSSARNHKIDDLEYGLSSEDADVRLGAVVELTAYGEAAVPSIKKALNDPDANVQKAAIRALGEIGGDKAAAALGETLKNPDRVKRIRSILGLIMAGRAGLPYLFKALETEPFPRARMFAAYGVARLAGPGDAPAIMELFPRQDRPTGMYLIIALAEIGDEEAYAGLSQIMQFPDPVLRYYVANSVAEHGAKEGLPILLEALDDEAPEVRMWGMYGLEKLELPESYPVVLAALKDDSYYVRKEAAYTLGILGNPEAVPHLIPYLEDTEYLVRGDVAESLGRLGDPQAIPALKTLLDEESDAVRIKAAEALARLDDYSGMETLVAVLDSHDQRYRVEAQNALQGISGEDFGLDSQAWSLWLEQEQKTISADAAYGSAVSTPPNRGAERAPNR